MRAIVDLEGMTILPVHLDVTQLNDFRALLASHAKRLLACQMNCEVLVA